MMNKLMYKNIALYLHILLSCGLFYYIWIETIYWNDFLAYYAGVILENRRLLLYETVIPWIFIIFIFIEITLVWLLRKSYEKQILFACTVLIIQILMVIFWAEILIDPMLGLEYAWGNIPDYSSLEQ